jgi:hypothetical protein
MGLRCVRLMAHLGRPTHAPGRRLSGVFLRWSGDLAGRLLTD